MGDCIDGHLVGLAGAAFEADNSRPGVFWAAGGGAYANTLKALCYVDLSAAKGKRVLLKPNIGRNVGPGVGIITHPQVVAAAIDAFRDAGADVAVGESPIVGVTMTEAFETSGIAAVAKERDCPLLDMDVRKYVPVEVPEGIAIKTLKVCRDVLEYDIVVSMPVMKTHMHTGVTLAVKNMKGCLWNRSKVDLHMLDDIPGRDEKPLDIAIVDMAMVLRPDLSIIDGTVGMEGLGPRAGKAKELGVVVVGADAFAADAVACDLMGIAADEVPHLRLGGKRGLGVIDLDRIKVTPENYEDVRSPFERPPEKLSIEFEGFNILDKNSCSACQSTLLMFLRKHAEMLREKTPGDKDIVIAIGKGHEKLPENTVCIGNCTAKHKNRSGVFIAGCPPVSSEILKAYFSAFIE